MKAYFILRATDVCGTVTFYTGKAGIEYVSDDERNAFQYETLTGARRKANVLNKMNAGWSGGWLFNPVGYIVNHGIVPASSLDDGFFGELEQKTREGVAKLHTL